MKISKTHKATNSSKNWNKRSHVCWQRWAQHLSKLWIHPLSFLFLIPSVKGCKITELFTYIREKDTMSSNMVVIDIGEISKRKMLMIYLILRSDKDCCILGLTGLENRFSSYLENKSCQINEMGYSFISIALLMLCWIF